MKTSKILLGLALGVVAASPAFAITDGPYLGAYVPDGTTYTSLNFAPGTTITTTGFSTAGGKVLDSVSITLNGFGRTTHTAMNPEGAGANIATGVGNNRMRSSYEITLTAPGGGSVVVSTPIVTSFFDPIAPGNSQTIGPADGSNSTTLSFNSSLGVFQGASVIFGVTATSDNSSNIGGSPVLTFLNSAKADVSITYTYHLAAVPEPRVYGAIGAVACLGLLGYRRLRARQAAQA